MVKSSPSPDHTTTLKGMIYMVLAMLVIPGLDVFAKLLAQDMSSGQITWFRFVVQTALITPIVIVLKLYHFERGTILLQAMRGILLAGATVFFFAALVKLSIAQAIAIFFVEPLILTIFSALFLGEVIRARRITAVIIGFIGALIIIRPSFAAVGVVALYPLVAAVCFALYMMITRQLKSVHPFQMQWMVGVSATIFMSALLLLGHLVGDQSGWDALEMSTPQGVAIWWVFGLGLVATIGHTILVLALRHAPASLLAPFQYLEIISATILGYLVFGDGLDLTTIFGVMIIIGSGLYVFRREALQKNIIEG